MKTALLPGETVIKEGAANLQRGIEQVGGKLFLTTHRLVFESHALNVQTGATIIALSDVSGTALCWTKVFGVLPLVPNSLAVSTQHGKQHRFVLYGRKKWQAAIDGQRAQA